MIPISIVLPVWNNLKYLEKWFQTFKDNTLSGREFEIIVVDQGSTDGSIEFIEKQSAVDKLIKNEKNTGSTGAWNQGIRASKHQWIAIMNSDIEFTYNGWIEKFLEEAKDDVGIVECLEVIWDKSTRWAGAAGFLLNRKMVEEIGLFDQKNFWGFCGDTDYWIRTTWHKWKMGWCKEVLYFHWCGGTHRKGQLKDSADKDWSEGNKRLYEKWVGTAVHSGWDAPRREVENWLQNERKLGRLA